MIPFIVIPSDILSDTRLSERHIRVLLALFSHRNPKTTNVVFPSRERLSELTGIKENKISAITSDLAKFGWLTKTGDGGRGKSAQYTLSESGSSENDVKPEQETLPKLGLNPPQIGTKPSPNRDLNPPQLGEGHRIDHRIDQEYKSESKKPYGEMGRVLLTDTERDKLLESYGHKLHEAIDVLDAYLAGKFKKDPYESHYAVMKRNGWVWQRVFTEQQSALREVQQSPKPAPYKYVPPYEG